MHPHPHNPSEWLAAQYRANSITAAELAECRQLELVDQIKSLVQNRQRDDAQTRIARRKEDRVRAPEKFLQDTYPDRVATLDGDKVVVVLGHGHSSGKLLVRTADGRALE